MNAEQDARIVRVFVSSPGDVIPERGRVQAVAAKLNRDYEGLVRFETVLWEEHFYKADRSFQPQIDRIGQPEACDVLVSIFWTRVGTALPGEFARMPNGQPYPSGTAYELLTALEASKAKGLPDVYVFRKTADAALPTADAERRRQAQSQLDALEAFWSEWFKSEQGQFKAAFQTFVSTDEFESQIEDLLRQWLHSRHLLGPRLKWPKERGSPFPGLAPFEAEQGAVFFGRDRVIDEARRRLAAAAAGGTPFLLIVGPSGSGKSSLARAGLIPRLTTPGMIEATDLWRVARMKPSEHGAGPVASLAAALFAALPELAEGDFPSADALTDNLRRGGVAAARPLIGALARVAETERRKQQADQPLRAGLMLLVDQLEELFANALGDDERAAFAEALKQLLASSRVWCVATLRADLYELLLKQPVLKEMKETAATLDLGPPGAAELAEIVRAPAAAAGLAFENSAEKGALDERLLADAKTADSLPLLQFALRYLYEKRVEADGQTWLTHDAYDALGGLQGAIAAEAERAVANLPAGTLDALPRLLRRLAEPSRDGKNFTLREVERADITAHRAETVLVDALLEARIIIGGTNAAGRATLRLAHEAVLTAWPRAASAAQASRVFYRVRAEVEDALNRWQEHGEPTDRLIQRGVPLAEAEKLIADFGDELPAKFVAYVNASRRQARLHQRLVAAAAVFFFGLAVAATGAGIWAYAERTQAQTQSQLANERLTTAQAAQSRSLTDIVSNLTGADDYADAIAVALEALPTDMAHPDRPYVSEAEYVLQAAFRTAQMSNFDIAWQKQLSAPVERASMSADGTMVATALGGTVTLYDRAANTQYDLPDLGEPIWAMRFLPNGWLVTASKTKLRAYNPASKKIAREIMAPPGKAICGWHFAGRSPTAPLEGFFVDASAAPDHLELATKQPFVDQELALASAACLPAGRPNAPILNAVEQVTGRTMGSPIAVDNSIATPSAAISAVINKSSQLWISVPNAPLRKLDREHENFVAAMPTPRFTIAAATSSGRVIVMDARTLRQLYELPPPQPGLSIVSLDVSEQGQEIMVAYNRSLTVLTGQADIELTPLSNGTLPRDANIATCTRSDSVRTIKAAHGGRIVQLAHGTAALAGADGLQSQPLTESNMFAGDAAFSPDGKDVFVIAEPVDNPSQKILLTYDATSGKLLGRQSSDFGKADRCMRVSPDGRHALVVSTDEARAVDFHTGTVIDRATNVGLVGAAFSPSGARFALYGPAGRLGLLDSATAKTLDTAFWPVLASKNPIPFGFDASGKRLLIAHAGGIFAWNVFPDTQALIEAARSSVPRCIAPADREKYYLAEQPPDWCITLKKKPYDTDAWRQWLAARKAGANPPMPLPPAPSHIH